MNKLPKIFSQATTTDWMRRKYDLAQPFCWGNYIWATDGRICVRTDCNGLSFDEHSRKLPDPELVPKLIEGLNGFLVKLPDAIGRHLCKACGGTGEITASEIVCEQCEMIHQTTYKGKPLTRDCEECEGKGSIPNEKAIQVSHDPLVYLAEQYVAILRENGVHEVGVYATDKPVRFFGDGFEGWLMVMDAKRVHEFEREKH